jgi:hypothetical protein
MRLKGFPVQAVINSAIHIKYHVMTIINGHISAKTLFSDILNEFDTNVEVTRVWGLPINNVSSRRTVPRYSRIIMEVAREKCSEILSRLKSTSIAKNVKKAYVLCCWCQIAEGNELPELMNGKPKTRLLGNPLINFAEIRVNPWPNRCCIR